MSDDAIKTLNTEGYKNWIKGGLGLLTVKHCLCQHTEYILKKQYEEILANNKEPDKKKYNLLKKAVTDNQLFSQKSWPNSKLQAKPPEEQIFTYVEYGKCFIRPAGYRNKTSICDIDFSGLLHILINNKGLHEYLKVPHTDTEDEDEKWKSENNVFAKALAVRNEILHNADENLDTEDLQGHLKDLIAVLDNLKALPEESEARDKNIKKAKGFLSQLQKTDFYISSTEELKVIREAINSVMHEMEGLKEKETRILKGVDQKHKALQSEHQNLEQRVCQLEQYKEKQDQLAASMHVYITQQSYIKEKQNLQDYLIKWYKRYYIKTSLCPLKPQDNELDISDVYVSPMLVEEQRKSSRKRRIDVVDLLRNNVKETKKIFVIGNVGTGKTSLCKIMLHCWCCSVEDSRNSEPYEEISIDDTIEFTDVIKEMKEFDIAFFLPLRVIPEGTVDIKEMIKQYFGEISNNRIIDDIFKSESAKCLILVDGLDEWRLPPPDDFRPLHHRYGIPTLSIMSKAKVIVTSQPTCTGILNMHESDYDLKVRLLGVHQDLLNTMVERYAERYDVERYVERYDAQSSLKVKFMKHIKSLGGLDHLEQTPMLLLQIFWQFVHEGKIGLTVSDIYSSILNIMFEWLHTRSKSKGLPSSLNESERFQLPIALTGYKALAKYQPLVISLSRIAFKIYRKCRMSAPISRRELEEHCDHVTDVLKIGILYEEDNYIPNDSTNLSFIHATFFEYFVALHTAHQFKKTESLDELFEHCRTIEDVVRFSSIIVMICELAPNIIESMCSHIYKIDACMDTQDGNPKGIQHIILKCLGSRGYETAKSIPLFSLVVDPDIDFSTTAELMRHIDTWMVRHLIVNACSVAGINIDIPGEQVFLTIKLFQMPETPICMPIRANALKSIRLCKCVLSHNEYSNLMLFIKQGIHLEFLEMKDIKCERNLNDHQDRHAIDLNNNKEIKTFLFENKESTYVSRLINDNLQRCIILSTGLTDIDCLLNSNNLQDLVFGGPDERHVNYNGQMNTVLQTLSQLQTLELRNMICNNIGPVVCNKMLKLKCIKLSYLQLRTQCWCTFLDSISTLQNSVKVESFCKYPNENTLRLDESLKLNSEDYIKVQPIRMKGTLLKLHFVRQRNTKVDNLAKEGTINI